MIQINGLPWRSPWEMGGHLLIRVRAHLDEEPEGAKRHGHCDVEYESHFGAAPVSYKPELVGRQGTFPLTALPSGHARGAGHCVTFPARYNYTTHCELRSRVRPTRRCGDMDIHSTSTGGAATKQQTRPWAIHHIAVRAEVRRHGTQCVGIVHDEPDG